MDDLKHPDTEIRAVLLKAARTLMAENAKFSVKTLLTKSGISREDFRLCFPGKADLLAALAGEDVRALSEILEAVQPVTQNLRATACGTVASVPVADQWLERRLRVFERTLGALEKRQEKSEQNFLQAIALINERLAGSATQLSEPAPEPAPPPPPEPDPKSDPEAGPELQAPALSVTVLAHVEEIQTAADEKLREKEMADFIAHAREVARNAALAEPAPPKARTSPWLAWGGAVAVLLLLVGMGLLLVGGALGHNAPPPGAGVIHRQVAKNGLPQIIALADNGNATAQTMLALAYLRGLGVTGDDAAAKRWSQAAAAQGQPVAEYLLGTLYLEDNRDESAAVRWFGAAAAQGNIKAMHNLAIAYAQGTGIAKDPEQAVAWFVRAASQGYRDSEFDLGVLYERGEGVPQDARAALKWYLVAAGRGDEPSALRAQTLKTQLDAATIQAAEQDAAAFVPLPVGSSANDMPNLKGQG